MTAYALGVDLGTTYSAAAVARGGTSEPLPLGTDAAQVPSVVVIREGGEILIGDAAERRAGLEPLNTAREFKRRLGDPVPIMIGGVAHPIESLMGHILRWIVARATEQEGEAPTVVVLTHPANYFGYKIGVLREAARLAGLDADKVVLLTEPEAAAIAYARQQRIESGEIVAVYDFGGGTFDAALVRRTGDRFELVGAPEGMERLGGIDFDQAIMAHVDEMLGGRIAAVDASDPATRAGLARLRSECRRAKEALSTDTDTVVPVALPTLQTDIRLTRAEFEDMVRPRIGETVTSLQRAVGSAGIGIEQVARVLLVGGTSRIPIVAETIRRVTGRPVGLDAHPKLAIAVGAGLAGAGHLPQSDGAAATAWRPPVPSAPQAGPATASSAAFHAAPVTPARAGARRRKGIVIGALGGGAAAVAVVAAISLTGGSDGPSSATTVPALEATGSTVAGEGAGVPTTLSGIATTVAPVAIPATAVVERVAFGVQPAGVGVPGAALDAGISAIAAIAVDAQDTVIVATPEGAILRVANGAVDLVVQLDATEGAPGGIAFAADGSLAVTTSAGVRSIRDGVVGPLLDTAAAGLGATPGPLAFDGAGNLYVVDNDHHRIVRRAADGTLTLVAGTGLAVEPGVITGDGQKAPTVPMGTITGLVVDGAGDLLLADATLLALRQIAVDGVITTRAGGGATPIGTAGSAGRDLAFGSLDGLSVDAQGRALVADATSALIVRIAADGTTDVLLGRSSAPAAADTAPLAASSVTAPGAIAVDQFGSVFFEDGATVRRIAGL